MSKSIDYDKIQFCEKCGTQLECEVLTVSNDWQSTPIYGPQCPECNHIPELNDSETNQFMNEHAFEMAQDYEYCEQNYHY